MPEKTLRLPTASLARPAGSDRRSGVRWRYHGLSRSRALGVAVDEGASSPASDLSARGIALILSCRVARGAILEVSLQRAAGRFLPPRLVRVRRVAPYRDGQWLAGCTFVRRLTEEELHGLLGQRPSP
jgi:hypothetical protein